MLHCLHSLGLKPVTYSLDTTLIALTVMPCKVKRWQNEKLDIVGRTSIIYTIKGTPAREIRGIEGTARSLPEAMQTSMVGNFICQRVHMT